MRPCVCRVRQYIESNFPGTTVTVPTKDSSTPLIDLLVKKTRTLSLKVYHSRDYVLKWNKVEQSVRKEFRAAGWFTPERKNIAQSGADYWVLELMGSEKNPDYEFIPRAKLLKKLEALHDDPSSPCGQGRLVG